MARYYRKVPYELWSRYTAAIRKMEGDSRLAREKITRDIVSSLSDIDPDELDSKIRHALENIKHQQKGITINIAEKDESSFSILFSRVPNCPNRNDFAGALIYISCF